MPDSLPGQLLAAVRQPFVANRQPGVSEREFRISGRRGPDPIFLGQSSKPDAPLFENDCGIQVVGHRGSVSRVARLRHYDAIAYLFCSVSNRHEPLDT